MSFYLHNGTYTLPICAYQSTFRIGFKKKKFNFDKKITNYCESAYIDDHINEALGT